MKVVCDDRKKICGNFIETIDGGGVLWYNMGMIEKRAIAFDIGNKRIGVAISDPFNEYAMPCETYFRVGNFKAEVAAIARIAKERGVGVIVCGMPVNTDGTESMQTIKTKEFIEALRKETDLPIELEDERFTTMQARETQIMGGVKRENRKKTIDSIAASYILESYLQRVKNQKKEKERAMYEEENLEEVYEDEDRIVEVETEDGKTERLFHIATIEYKGNLYCVFQREEPQSEEEEDEVFIYALDEENELLLEIEDGQLLDEVFAEFCNQYEKMEGAEDAMKLDK